MDSDEFKKRTKTFARNVIHLVESLPRNLITDAIGRQLLRSGTSVGANYRSACRAKSAADFTSKMGTVEEEADETLYWMELLMEDEIIDTSELKPLMKEANEILAMTVSSINTAKINNRTKTKMIGMVRNLQSESRNGKVQHQRGCRSNSHNPKSAIRNPQ